MRSPSLYWLLVLLTLATTVFASWTKDDHEIFDLVSELETHEGKGTDFYKFLDVAPGASVGALNRAYRKRSLELHPDKNPNIPEVHERFARLGKIAAILRNSEKRERYDFFYKNGVPRWRGTGYYYSRYRPGITEVVLFLVLVTTGVHYLILRINHRRDLSRIDYFRRSALRSAGVSTPTTTDGSALGLGRAGKSPQVDGQSVESALNQAVLGDKAGAAADPSVMESSGYTAQAAPTLPRAERRKQLKASAAAGGGGSSREGTPAVSRASSVTPGGGEGKRRKVKVPLIEGSDRAGSLDLIVVDREVFIAEPHGGLTPLSSLAPRPSASSLWPIKLVASVISIVRTRLSGATEEVEEVPSTDEAADGNKQSRRRKPARVVESVSVSVSASEDEGEEEQEAGAAAGAKKKKRNGNGKVAGMRRRKALAGK